MPGTLERALRALSWLVLGGWMGMLVFFPLAVAPAILRGTGELGSAEAGARIVAAVLVPLEFAGVVAGLLLAALAALRRLGPTLVLLPLLLAGATLAGHLLVTREMARIRPGALGAAPEPALSERYFRLHRRSQWLYTAVGAGTVLLAAALGAREIGEARQRPRT